MKILNVAGYRFVQLLDIQELKLRLEAEGSKLDLKGTILLVTEGINLFLAGGVDEVMAFLNFLRGDPRFDGFEVKESWSDEPPFRRLRVRLKKEIITMKHPMIRPEAGRAPAVDAATLKRWLDQGHDDRGQPVAMLDTRNRYEIEQGTFRGAITPPIRHFSQFPEFVSSLGSELQHQTVVTFCTGGIRCEKAALYLREQGFGNVLQLDGGILKYFEIAGGAHYEGKCFVFDNRINVDADLQPESPSGTMREGPFEEMAGKNAETKKNA